MALFEKKENKKEKRFVVKSEQTIGMGGIQVIVDTVTGVNYLNTVGGSFQGLTPLLDDKGNVVIDKTDK